MDKKMEWKNTPGFFWKIQLFHHTLSFDGLEKHDESNNLLCFLLLNEFQLYLY